MMSGTVLSAVRATYVHSAVPARPSVLPVGRGREPRRAKGVAIRASNVQEPQANAWDADEETHNEMSAEVLEGLKERFVKADTDKSGMIDKEELQALLESTGSGQEYLTEHWLTEEDVEKVMEQYDRDSNGLIDFNEFIQLAQDGVLLEGKLSEYRQAFDAVDTSSNGTIGANELAQLFSDLDQPLTFDKLACIFEAYDKDASGQIEFGEFLRMFRSHLLDLNEVLNYIKTQPRASDLATSSGSLVEPGAGEVTLIFSEQELDDALAIHHTGLTVLFAGLTWCRPCKGVQKPFVNLAERYMDVRFLKFFGNANDNTKNLFKNRLKIRATPSFCFFREGQLVHAMSGANKTKLETQMRLLLQEEELAEPLYAGHPTVGKLGRYA